MNSTEEAAALRFEPPGPGSWKLDAVHFPRPMTRYWTEMHPEAFAKGVSDFTRFYGMLLDRLECGYVNNFCYMAAVPVTDDEVPNRIARAQEVIDRKLWRQQLKDWDETIKPASIRKHRELLEVEPDSLSDEALADYLARCRDHHSAMISQHMRHTAAAVVPTGDLLAHVADWTDVSPADLLDLLGGSAPVSAGASEELENLVAALRKDSAARAVLSEKGDPRQPSGNCRRPAVIRARR